MPNIGKFIGRFPFAGKLTIRPFVIKFRKSKTPEERRRNFRNLMIVMAIYIVMHIAQAILGFWATSFSAPVWAQAYFYLYGASNAVVVLTQCEITVRSILFHLRCACPATEKTYRQFSLKERIVARTITISGQILFYGMFFFYLLR